ncbi:hypothetical protein ACFORJ_00360 [Corynebacterium hansenii]|uniref:SWIM-type domain-containing protein n=1 Tax=Corynebacterium hansenii TaxID=394964 RepID=A0ABV7ZJ94_9CORY|nr:hypothetical protein [Corynebacterium hansenii]WJY99548.1 hypothetical protein CHAN_04625 [Corynebacterium hansenii]
MADGDVTWGDNVIYADFGARGAGGGTRGARRGKKGPGRRKADSGQARPRTDVARRLYDAVAGVADGGRRERGEAYFRDGHVLGFRMVDGQVVGEVKGSQIEPFTVVIKLPYRDAGAADGVLRWLAATNGAADELARGTLPEVPLGKLLLAADEAPVCRCSCPDPAPACKHAVAVAAAAARAIDAEPMNALELRGVGVHEAKHRLAGLMAEAAAKSAGRGADGKPRGPVRRTTGPRTEDPVLELVREDFWGADLPSIEVPAPAPMVVLRDTDPTLLHAALRSTTVLSVETLRAVSDLEDCWDHLTSPPSFDDGDFAAGAGRPRGEDDDGVVAASFDDEE